MIQSEPSGIPINYKLAIGHWLLQPSIWLTTVLSLYTDFLKLCTLHQLIILFGYVSGQTELPTASFWFHKACHVSAQIYQ